MPQVLERPVVEAEAEAEFEDAGFDAEAAHTQYILDALAEAEEYDARPDAVSYSSKEVWIRYVQKILKEGKVYDAQHPSIPWDEALNRIKARHPDVQWN